MSDKLLYRQDDVVSLVEIAGCVPLPAHHLHVIPRHLRRLGVGATVFSVSAGVGTNIGTAAVGHNISLLRLADEGAVGGGDEDGGAGGSGQQGDPAVVRGLLTYTLQGACTLHITHYILNITSQGAQPGVAVAGVL